MLAVLRLRSGQVDPLLGRHHEAVAPHNAQQVVRAQAQQVDLVLRRREPVEPGLAHQVPLEVAGALLILLTPIPHEDVDLAGVDVCPGDSALGGVGSADAALEAGMVLGARVPETLLPGPVLAHARRRRQHVHRRAGTHKQVDVLDASCGAWPTPSKW